MHDTNSLKWLIGGGSVAVGAVVAVFFILSLTDDVPGQDIDGADTLYSEAPAETSNTLCKGHRDGTIAYERLSNESSTPFVMFGRPVSAERSDYGEYKTSIAA